MSLARKIISFHAFAIMLMSGVANAAEWSSASHKIYSGDYDGDGRADIFLKGAPKFVPIAGDIMIPLLLPTEHTDYVLQQQSGGDYIVVHAPSRAITDTKSWSASQHKVHVGDFNGDGSRDYFLQGNSNGIASITLLAGASNTALIGAVNRDNNLVASNATITVTDVNGDGKQDLSVVTSSSQNKVAYGDGLGGFAELLALPYSADGSEVGAIAGNFRVDESGSATYQIPLTLPAGTAGVAPQLSLNYSSQAGNGLLGLGWSLQGLSSISRCRQTLGQDGQAKAITWSANDRFCLDGQRLLVQGGAAYGAVNATYKTEVDSFVTVTSNGGSAGHPVYFTVKRKDGSLSTYGGNSNAQQKNGAGNVMSWAQNEFKDSVGNPIVFNYSNDTAGHRINTIQYAYGNGSSAAAKVQFVYDARLDPISGYVAGHKFATQKRLDKIVVSNDGQEVRNYQLGYKPVLSTALNKLSRVELVKECVGEFCLPATEFEWSDSQISFSTSGSSISLGGSHSRDLGAGNFQPADVNGDGLMDIVWFYHLRDGQNDVDYQLRYAISDGTKLVPRTYTNDKLTVRYHHDAGLRYRIIDYNGDGRQDVVVKDGDSGNWKVHLSVKSGTDWKLNSSVIVTPISDKNAIFADFNSDGLVDVLYERDTTFDLYVRYLSKIPGVSSTSSIPYQFSAESSYGSLSSLLPSTNGGAVRTGKELLQPSGALDVNGDGVNDILVRAYYKDFTKCDPWLCVYNNAYHAIVRENGELNSFGVFHEAKSINYGKSTPVFLADYNSDGHASLIAASSLKYNTGDGFLDKGSLGVGFGIQSVDYNADSHPDVLWHDSVAKKIKVKLWDPSTEQFRDAINVASTDGDTKTSHNFFDVNGDGITDYVKFKSDKLYTYLGIANGVTENKITKITSGLGARTFVGYEALSKTANYERHTIGGSSNEFCFSGGCTYSHSSIAGFYTALNSDWSGTDTLGKTGPVLELNGPMAVVTNVSSSAPAGINKSATSSISYYYAEAKIQASGRGFLGFERLKTVDDQTGVQTITTYRQDWPFIGYPQKTEVYSAADKLLSQSENTWRLKGYSSSWKTTAKNSGTAALGSLQPFMSKSEERTYNLVNNGASAGGLIQRIITDNIYDTYGNPTQITVTTKNGSNATVATKQTANTYGSSAWEQQMGRLSRTVVTSTRGSDSKTRTSAFEYYTSGDHKGLLSKEIIEPDLPQYRLATTYTYDAFGNKVKAEQQASDVAETRFTESFYDALGRYMTHSKNAYGQTTESVLSRNALGQVTAAQDINGVTVTTEYSPMGRQFRQSSAVGSSSETLLTSCGSSGCPATASYYAHSSDASGAESKTYYDLLGREVRTASRRFNGSWAYVDTEYDNLGRVARKSEPHSGSAQYWTVMHYDILGRVVKTDLPGISASPTMAYNGLTSVTTNPKGQTKTEVKNELGELVSVTDDLGGRIQYQYDTEGNLRYATTLGSLSEPRNVTVEMQYDHLGRKSAMNDPDKGSWTYQYNGFGELVSQTDAKLQTTTMSYDRLGRMVGRIDKKASGDIEGNTVWSYNNSTTASAGYALGALTDVMDSASGYAKVVSYDNFGRVDQTITSLAANDDHYEKVIYDNIGRTHQVFDAANDVSFTKGIQNHYNAYGYLHKVTDTRLINGQPKAVYYTVNAMDVRGNVTEAVHGNGVVTSNSFDPATGRLLTIDSLMGSGVGEVQDHSYSWDDLGNLMTRLDQSGSKNLTETFVYDDLNRLTSSQVTGKTAQALEYDILGNITRKSDVGDYTYGENGHGPHAVTSTSDGIGYSYDANGNLLSDTLSTDGQHGGRTLQYTTFDKPFEITKGDHTTSFVYGPDRARFKRTDTNASGTKVTRYIGGVEKITNPDNTQEIKRYIGSALVTISLDNSGVETGEATQYLHKDHLGSVDVITDALGNIVQELSFDAWGQRRDAVDWASLDVASLLNFDASNTTRGFTGHEMLDEVGLVHMNGRIYDARLGRFLQADPFIQAAGDTQMYNRYSYVRNNPLNATDPSGYFIVALASIVAYAITTDIVITAVVAGIVAFAQALHYGADLGDALIAGVSAGAMTYLAGTLAPGAGAGFTDLAVYGLQMGVVGGITSVLQGGKFGHGFVSAGVGSAVGASIGPMSKSPSWGNAWKAIGRMTLAGTLSKATGGKFANGAGSAAFGLMMGAAVKEAASAVLKDDTGRTAVLDGPVGDGTNLYDGKIVVHAAGEGAELSESDLSTVKTDLNSIFTKGGGEGQQLQRGLSSEDPLKIIVNKQGVHAAYLKHNVLTLDLGSTVKMLDVNTGEFTTMSTTRILAHEMGHAVLGKHDIHPIMPMVQVGGIEYQNSPIVKFTDRLMKNIHGDTATRRKYY